MGWGRLILIWKSLIIKPNGMINVSDAGYLGGFPCGNTSPNQAFSGESLNGKGSKLKDPNQGGGGGGSNKIMLMEVVVVEVVVMEQKVKTLNLIYFKMETEKVEKVV